MLFNQLSFYTLSDEIPDARLIEPFLEEKSFVSCPSNSWSSEGFVPAGTCGTKKVCIAQDTLRFCLKREEKILPASMIRDVLDDRINSIRMDEGRNVGRKERQDIKDSIVTELLPRAMTKNFITTMMLVPGFLFVDTASVSRADSALHRFRGAMCGFKAHRPRTRRPLPDLLKAWLLSGDPVGISSLDVIASLKILETPAQ